MIKRNLIKKTQQLDNRKQVVKETPTNDDPLAVVYSAARS